MNKEWFKTYGLISGIAFTAGILGSWFAQSMQKPQTIVYEDLPSRQVRYDFDEAQDFTLGAETGLQSVVSIKTVSSHQNNNSYWDFWDFFGNRGPVSGAGSGVIVSPDGYIVTNNHVIDKADQIEVTLNNKHTYPAKIIGLDPSTDLALLKIEATQLKAIMMGNSDLVKTGEWVLAVGNPFNLTSTVTAGIVSAKGRNINIVKSQFPIESFIQTDAAINPGNSGGALVDTKGILIGINTAIASQTGAYNGYGFAIPVNIVKKVIRDLKEFGTVQRSFLGAEVSDINHQLAQQIKVNNYNGVYVEGLDSQSPAEKAGIQIGDILLRVENRDIDSKASFLEQLAYTRPGDKIKVLRKRGNDVKEVIITLENSEGGTSLMRSQTKTSEKLGADLAPLTKVEKTRFSVDQGWRISNIKNGVLARMGLPDGYIILSINKVAPKSIEELEQILENTRGRITIEGINPNGSRGYFSFFSY